MRRRALNDDEEFEKLFDTQFAEYRGSTLRVVVDHVIDNFRNEGHTRVMQKYAEDLILWWGRRHGFDSTSSFTLRRLITYSFAGRALPIWFRQLLQNLDQLQ